MKTRSIKELLIILRDSEKHFAGGLCFTTRTLFLSGIITKVEESELDSYIRKNGPSNVDTNGFKWIYDLWEPRFKWLNEEIEKLDKQT